MIMELFKKPMTPGPRAVGGASCHIRVCEALPMYMRPVTREVNILFTVPGERRKGYATTLMHLVSREADIANITLVLFLKPFDSEGTGMTAEDLEVWYTTNFGFQVIQHEPKLLARAPGTTPRTNLRLTPVTRAVIESARHD